MAEAGDVFEPADLNNVKEIDKLIGGDDDDAMELKPITPTGDGDKTIDFANTSTSTRRGSAEE